jgi:hypothetical protein
MKTKKLLPLILLTANCLLLPNFAFAALNSDPLSSNQSFSESSAGVGLSAGIRFNLVSDVFTDSEEIELNRKNDLAKNSKQNPDHIFTEIGIFGNQFLSGEIKQNFGGKLNLGYETSGLRIYGSGGYVASTFDYQEQSKTKESLVKSAPFFGGGIGYDITKNISLRLDGMFYNFDFKPKNSSSQKVDVSVAAGTIGIGFYF